ncbi:hypothetical protein HNO89_002139 [Sporosarcina luteola]|nr:hypothetical protein [Sporosarcina luteola]
MKNEKSEKKQWWMFFLSFGAFSTMWFFVFYLLNRQVNEAKEAIYFGTPIGAYWVYFLSALIFGLTSWGIYFCTKEAYRKKSFQDFKVNALGVFRLAWLPLLCTLPFLYLATTNALLIKEENMTFNPFWSFEKHEYTWEDGVKAIEISYSITRQSNHQTNFNGNYILYLKDGKRINLWQDTLEGDVLAIQEIDRFFQKKNIPFHVTSVPSEEMITRYFSENAEFIRDLYSR